MANPFEQVRPKSGDADKSLQWYQTQVRRLGALRPNKLMADTPHLVNTIQPGNMYMFLYDAKWKDTLPYFDMFPLVLPFRKVPGGFLGLNLHYLPYAARFKLLGILSEYASDDRMDEHTKIVVSWKLLNSTSRLNMIKPCVKKYLTEQLQSRFLHIMYPDWITASMLPVEKFTVSKTRVWNDSRAMY